jgi:hypothetical protein
MAMARNQVIDPITEAGGEQSADAGDHPPCPTDVAPDLEDRVRSRAYGWMYRSASVWSS